jgi:hemoglobin
MRTVPTLLASLILITATTAVAQQKSLFERLGGKAGITAVVDEFVTRCVLDKRINKKFARSDAPRLKAMLVDQLCNATGGGCDYHGRDMKTAHQNMGVTEGEFGALVENLTGALDKFKVQQSEKDELLKLLSPMKPAIVEVNSKETGTALPTGFKPAPSLKQMRMEQEKKKNNN